MQSTTPPRPTAAPKPAEGEVRVRLCWWRLPDGAHANDSGGAAGVIDQLGPGIAAQRLGMPVWLWACREGPNDEPPARWRVLPSAHAVGLPDAVPIDAGACLGTTALAAMLAVQAYGGVAGQRVLVEDGASPFGHYALQFARLGGAALVLARATSPIASGLALDDGAHATLQGDAADAEQHLAELTDGAGIDRVIAADAARRLKPERMGNADLARALCQLQAWLERGLVRHRVAARWPLARIEEARASQRANGDGYAATLIALD